MNTRRKPLQPKASAPSVRWHLMHEAFHPLFLTEARDHVEDWYNLGATGMQRDHFRSICAEMFAEDPETPDPANRNPFTAACENDEAELMLKHFGRVLSPLGKRKARVWILHRCNRRRRDNFRDAFGGCQTVFEKKSVMHRDYIAPEAESYTMRDNTHAHRSVDWTSLQSRREMQALQSRRRGRNGGTMGSNTDPAAAPGLIRAAPAGCGGAIAAMSGSHGNRRPSAVVADQMRPAQRTTKPRSQFDGANNLTALGYSADVPVEQVVADLKSKHQAHQQARSYYVDKDGSTVYVAANAGVKAADPGGVRSVSGGGILASVTSDPITQWRVKTCDY